MKKKVKVENQIVVYQPSETVRLDVRLENDTVWLTQKQLCDLFGVVKSNISYHLKNIFDTQELDYDATVQKIRTVQFEGGRNVLRNIEYFNLDVIISLGYRVNSRLGIQFRQWATRVLKEHLLRGYTINSRMDQMENRFDRHIIDHDKRIEALENRVDFFVQTNMPPTRGVFFDGQLWDACSLVERLISSATSSILLIDSWVGAGTLDILAKKHKDVSVEIVTTGRGNQLASTDIEKFNKQYGGLTICNSNAFHDRFLILDDKELYLIGASLKDLGLKCFGFTKMDGSEIAALKARI